MPIYELGFSLSPLRPLLGTLHLPPQHHESKVSPFFHPRAFPPLYAASPISPFNIRTITTTHHRSTFVCLAGEGLGSGATEPVISKIASQISSEISEITNQAEHVGSQISSEIAEITSEISEVTSQVSAELSSRIKTHLGQPIGSPDVSVLQQVLSKIAEDLKVTLSVEILPNTPFIKILIREFMVFGLAIIAEYMLPRFISLIVFLLKKFREIVVKKKAQETPKTGDTRALLTLLNEYCNILLRHLLNVGQSDIDYYLWFAYVTRLLIVFLEFTNLEPYIIPPLKVFLVFCICLFLYNSMKAASNTIRERIGKGNDVEQMRRRLKINLTLRMVTLIVIVTVGLLLLRFFVGVKLEVIAAFGGGSGIAIGFAAQRLVENAFGGLNVFFGRPFNEGDLVSSQNFQGRVKTLDIVRTTLLTPDNRIVYVPNSEFVSAVVINESVRTWEEFQTKVQLRKDQMPNANLITKDIRQHLLDKPTVVSETTPRAYIHTIDTKGGGLLRVSCGIPIELDNFAKDQYKQEIVLEMLAIIQKYENLPQPVTFQELSAQESVSKAVQEISQSETVPDVLDSKTVSDDLDSEDLVDLLDSEALKERSLGETSQQPPSEKSKPEKT